MQRAPHRRRAHDLPGRQQTKQVITTEAIQPGPQTDERWPWGLRLEADEPRHDIEHAGAFTREKHLARERGAIELTCGQRGRTVRGQGATILSVAEKGRTPFRGPPKAKKGYDPFSAADYVFSGSNFNATPFMQ